MRLGAVLLCCWCPTVLLAAPPAKLPRVEPEAVGMRSAVLGEIDRLVKQALADKRMPGCVVCVVRNGQTAFLRAYGQRQVEPSAVAMTTDTLFDMASLTKPVATATSVMLLVEQGKLRIEDPVSRWLPEFGQQGKEAITVYHLLTHQAGLVADNRLADYADGPEAAWRNICELKPIASPGKRFVYSDVGYIVLGELVKRVSGESLDQFAAQRIYAPLGMSQTRFLPDEAQRRQAAPTERRDDRWLIGEVHDPRAARLGGVAGHAGLFSTAEDLAVYAQMLLDGGVCGGVRLLKAETIARMTRGYDVVGVRRGLGWDMRSGYSSNRSPWYSDAAFGHGGFSGTAMWIDPATRLAVIFLSNRLHPDGSGQVNALAARIGGAAAEAISDVKPSVAQVLPGIDVLARDGFKPLAGRRVGLITNHTGVNRAGVPVGKILKEAPGVKLVALFSPEHGLYGNVELAKIDDTRDPVTGLVVRSLYGRTRKPTAEMVADVDAIVFDIQDIGARFYTYISTMGLAMQAAAEHKLRFVVLDRPNPITGLDVSGPLLDPGRESFVAFHRLPARHGMTVGELARLFADELKLTLDLVVVPVEGWRRSMYFDATGLPWINPSPNIRNLTAALVYPGVGLLETTNMSVGRGTAAPFETFGAPWLDGARLATELNDAPLPGVRCDPIEFTPDASVFAGQACKGVRLTVTSRAAFDAVRTGLEIGRRLQLMYPKTWKVDAYDRLLGNRAVLDAIRAGKPVKEIEAIYRDDLSAFEQRRRKHLLY